MRTLLKQSLLLTLLALPLLMANAQSRNEWYGKQAMQGEHLTLNPEMIEIFNTLDKTFPKRYLINEEPNHVGMWVVYKFKGRKEYEEYRPLIKKLIDRINRMPAYRAYTERLDSAGMEGYSIALTPKTDTYEQTDYVNLAIRPKEMRFHYRARIDNTPMPWEQRQDVADAVDQMLNEYINRTGVTKKDIRFDGRRTNYNYLTFTKPSNCTLRCSGTCYIVPNCTTADYDRIYRFIRGYALSNSVTVASNDFLGIYEEIAIGVNQKNRRPLMVGAALKGTDLYLIRTEGDVGSHAWLPRAWAEDNPVHP